MKTNEKGITLITLVVTIVILLILAGIVISSLAGDNGLFKRAKEAREETLIAQEDELRNLTILEAATHLEEYEYEDESGKKVTIPAQCAVSQIEGENTLADGLVIIDANGNEWVWIEVPESVTASSTTDGEIENALISYVSEYRLEGYSDTWYEGCGLEEQEYADRYSEMLQSIKANNGFFVGRYEVGSFDAPVTGNDTTRKTVIQKGAYPYNLVRCSQAQELSEELAIGNKTSSLMFGIQWDLVLKYLETKGVPESELKTNSGSWGNYRDVEFAVEEGNKYVVATKWSLEKWNDIPANYKKTTFDTDGDGVLLTTGATVRNSKMNIYDLAGNVWEWILEKSASTSHPCTSRGGNYGESGSYYPVSGHGNGRTSYSDYSHGFRPVLY